MIHNHEVPGSIPGPATKKEFAVGWLPRLAVFLLEDGGIAQLVRAHDS